MQSQQYTHMHKYGTTSYHLAWSPINQGYMVWREDDGNQSLVRIFNDADEAAQEYIDRVEFYKQVIELGRYKP